MWTSRGQSNIVGVILLLAILVASVGAAFTWGVPLIEKNEDRATVDSVLETMKQVDQSITTVARQGGTRTISFDTRDGFLEIDTTGFNESANKTDYVLYETRTRAAYIATAQFVPIFEDDMQGTSQTNYEGFGLIGRDDPGVLLGKAEARGERFNTIFRLEYRLLRDNEGNEFKIDLIQGGNLQVSGGKHRILIESVGSRTNTTQTGTRTVREVRIRID